MHRSFHLWNGGRWNVSGSSRLISPVFDGIYNRVHFAEWLQTTDSVALYEPRALEARTLSGILLIQSFGTYTAFSL